MKVVADICAIVSRDDSRLVLSNVAPVEHGLEKYVARPRFYSVLLGAFSMIAAAIAAIGIYGLMALLVSKRVREIGIRIAVGAERGQVMWLILRHGLVLAGMGISIGLAGALGLTKYLKNLLFGLTATDPLTFAAVAGIVLLVAALASYVPARRAMNVDPIVALRHE